MKEEETGRKEESKSERRKRRSSEASPTSHTTALRNPDRVVNTPRLTCPRPMLFPPPYKGARRALAFCAAQGRTIAPSRRRKDQLEAPSVCTSFRDGNFWSSFTFASSFSRRERGAKAAIVQRRGSPAALVILQVLGEVASFRQVSIRCAARIARCCSAPNKVSSKCLCSVT